MRFFTILLLCISTQAVFSQTDTLLFTPVSEYPYPAPFTAYTAHFDKLHRPYIYTANKEYGVILFDFSDLQNPTPVRTFTVQQFQNLKPTDLVQQGNYLYVALGAFGGLSPEPAGLAIIDISDPKNATITGQWSDAAFDKGCAAIRVDGDYAYLGAFERGVIIVDIANPAMPAYRSHIELDLNWPVTPGLFNVPHARGFALRGNELWTCFDAGGLRLVDISDKNAPFEAAQYINTDLTDAAAPAYNTATIVGDYLYAAVDYCGIDVVDIGNPAAPENAGWANPWNCLPTNWDGRPGHTNQVTTACHDSLLFASGADTEIVAFSIADPVQPKIIGQFGALRDSVATWGIDANDSLVVLAQVWNPLNFPYLAKYGGIRLLRWSCPAGTSGVHDPEPVIVSIAPNPVTDRLQIRFNPAENGTAVCLLRDMQGRQVRRLSIDLSAVSEPVFQLDMAGLPQGVYLLSFIGWEQAGARLVVKI
ncbi:MAG: hypothetical protein IPM36_05565 [Lewinellaceae bacterium]|nr:hypothetical protein [Lewinellaceae bacterium]